MEHEGIFHWVKGSQTDIIQRCENGKGVTACHQLFCWGARTVSFPALCTSEATCPLPLNVDIDDTLSTNPTRAGGI